VRAGEHPLLPVAEELDPAGACLDHALAELTSE
jgi:hypothetical protein